MHKNLDTIFNISETREIYTFWKLKISTNISSFFVEFVRSPETHVLAPTRFLSGGTHPHFLLKEEPPSLSPFLAIFIRREEISSPRVCCPFSLLLHRQALIKPLLKEKWRLHLLPLHEGTPLMPFLIETTHSKALIEQA